MYHWYLIQAKPGQVLRAQQALENQAFDTYLPMIEVEKTVKGKLSHVSEPLFPGYLFIYLSSEESNWRPIRSTRGVARLVSFGDTPAIVPSEVVNQIRQQLKSREIETAFEARQPVEITDGPFQGLKAIFQGYDGDQRAFLLLELLGRWQRISVDLDKVTKRTG